jgi:hypothetical protein
MRQVLWEEVLGTVPERTAATPMLTGVDVDAIVGHNHVNFSRTSA